MVTKKRLGHGVVLLQANRFGCVISISNSFMVHECHRTACWLPGKGIALSWNDSARIQKWVKQEQVPKGL
jgi:hypothetical protein